MNKNHLLTVAVEDYFQATALGKLVPDHRWSRFESRIEPNTHRTLDLLDEYGIKATFFVLGWIADKMPDVCREIVNRGHELASKGYYHKPLHKMLRDEFQEDARNSKQAIEQATGKEVLGYRIAQGRFGIEDIWVLELLSEAGYRYDSSFYPRFRSIASEPWRRFPHIVHCNAGDIWECPLSSTGTDFFLLPAAGGNYFRQAPKMIVKMIFRQWAHTYDSPFNMYFHIWELDPELPIVTSASWLSKIRMYRNIGKMQNVYVELFQQYNFQGLARHLNYKPVEVDKSEVSTLLDSHEIEPNNRTNDHKIGSREKSDTIINQDNSQAASERTDVTIVIPCYNEELVLPYLSNTLREVKQYLINRWRLKFLFVDDGSSDNTWEALNQIFGRRKNFAMVRHSKNQGVAAAILTGLRNADTEIVCSIDCDCTYDPHQIETMIPMLDENVAMVTASPYHKLGQVLNVPGWRLFLSKGLSSIYRHLLHHKFATYTSCFRVYRRSALKNIEIQNTNFLGILETLALLDINGNKIVECPAILEVRIFGTSKMKTVRTIFGHLGLIFHILKLKFKKKTIVRKIRSWFSKELPSEDYQAENINSHDLQDH